MSKTGNIENITDIKETPIDYGDRETLDAELAGAVGDILSAEQEAKGIIAKAEESVKAIQLDFSVRERELRENANRFVNNARDNALKTAAERAQAEREKRVAQADRDGAALIKAKEKTIEGLVKKLYASFGGKA